jgi:heat shock protein HslJ
MNKIRFWSILLLNLTMLACVVKDEEASADLNGNWKVSKLNGIDVLSKGATCTIDTEKKEAGGNSSCNSYGTILTLDEAAKKISFGTITTTKIGCQNSIEEDYYIALPKINTFEFKGTNTLQLKESNAVLIELVR